MLHVKTLFVYKPAVIGKNAKNGVVAFIWTPNDIGKGNSRKPRIDEKVSFELYHPSPEEEVRFRHKGPGVRIVAQSDKRYLGWVRVFDKHHIIDRLVRGGDETVIKGSIEEGYKSYWANGGGTCVSGRVFFEEESVIVETKVSVKPEIVANE